MDNDAFFVPVPIIEIVESFSGSTMVQSPVFSFGALKSSETITRGLFVKLKFVTLWPSIAISRDDGVRFIHSGRSSSNIVYVPFKRYGNYRILYRQLRPLFVLRHSSL